MDRSLLEKNVAYPSLVKPPAPLGPPRILLLLALVGALGCLAWALFTYLAVPPGLPAVHRQPFAFRLVEQRYDEVSRFGLGIGSRTEVEALLGPPTQFHVDEPELKEFEERLDNGGRNDMPWERVWEKWTDPNDNGRWVAVLYAGEYRTSKVWATVKKGF